MSVGVTALVFLRGDVLGEEYQNDLFVADYNNDYLYDFKLSDDRTKLHLEGDPAEKIANDNEELENVALGKGFGLPILRKDQTVIYICYRTSMVTFTGSFQI